MTINERVKFIILSKEKSQANFATKHGMSRQYIGQWTRKGGSVGIEVVSKLLYFYPDVNARWLIIGDGDAYESNTDKVKQTHHGNGHNISASSIAMDDCKSRLETALKEIEYLKEINQLLKNQLNKTK
ncbi:MAG: hypothetical protein WCO63_01185 [Bacteroidota bacterium]